MADLKWDQSLAVGIEAIDQQHQTWIEHYNEVAEAVATHDDQNLVVKTLGFLIDYTEEHFTAEEKQMAETNYPEIEAHQAKHNELRKTLADLVRDYEEEGVHQDLATAVNTLLRNWLIQHIQEVDKKFGAFVQAQA